MPCCQTPSGGATGRQQSRQRPRWARWGEPTPMPSVLALAALESELAAVVRILDTDPKDRLACALASLGRVFMARDS